MTTMRSIIVGTVLTAVLSTGIRVPLPASASDPFIGKVTIGPALAPPKDGSCPFTLDYEVSAEILKKPFYGVYGWEITADGGKTWESISYSTLVVEKDSEEHTVKMSLTTSLPDDGATDGKKHTYLARWVYAYGALRGVSEPVVFTCGGGTKDTSR